MYIRESSFTARRNHDAAQGRGTVRAGVHTVDIHLFQKTDIYIYNYTLYRAICQVKRPAGYGTKRGRSAEFSLRRRKISSF